MYILSCWFAILHVQYCTRMFDAPVRPIYCTLVIWYSNVAPDWQCDWRGMALNTPLAFCNPITHLHKAKLNSPDAVHYAKALSSYTSGKSGYFLGSKGQFIVDADGDATQTQRRRRNVKIMQITWFIHSRRRRNADATQTQRRRNANATQTHKSRVKKFNFLLRLICV